MTLILTEPIKTTCRYLPLKQYVPRHKIPYQCYFTFSSLKPNFVLTMMFIFSFIKVLKSKPLQNKSLHVVILLKLQSKFVLLISKTSSFSMIHQILIFWYLIPHKICWKKATIFAQITLKDVIFGTLLLHYFSVTSVK